MKLNEFFTNIINVTEAFNSEFDSLEWEKFNDGLIGTAKIRDEEFKLYLEPSLFSVGPNRKNWLNVAFARKINGQLSQDLISTGSNQSVQLGSIVNALKNKVKELTDQFDIDAIVFVVEKGQEKRISFYKKILMSKVYGLRPWQYRMSIEWFGGTALVATKTILDKDYIDALEREIKSRNKLITSY